MLFRSTISAGIHPAEIKREENEMQRKEAIYITRRDTCLASDPIIPYGGKVGFSSEKKKKEAVLELLNVHKKEKP